jgi:hypothetical protein
MNKTVSAGKGQKSGKLILAANPAAAYLEEVVAVRN